LLLPGIIVGLYASRLVAESFPGAWRFRALALLALGCVALGLGLLVLLRRSLPHTWPLATLAVYVFWPQVAPTLAWGLLLVVVCTMLAVNAHPHLPGPWLEIAVSLAGLLLYMRTLAPTVLPADSGEFQLVSYVLGVAHPPGYPLYTLLGKLFTLLPLGDVAYRLNLFAAVCGAATLGVVAHSVRRGTGSQAAALVAAAAPGLSTTFWAQSTTANIRSLTALFTALCLALLLRWGEERSARRLVALGICFGLGVGHHSSLLLLGLPFLAYLLACEPRLPLQPRRWLPALGAFLASFVVLLYLPLRSLMGTSFDPEPIRSWSGFVSHVLALGFRGDMFYFRSLPELLARLRVWLGIMGLEFGTWLSLAALGAALVVGARRWRALLLLAGVWAVNAFSALTYRAPQTVEYLIPSYVALAVLLGYGVGLVSRSGLRRSLLGVLVGLLLLAAALKGVANYPSFQLLHHDTSARDYAQAILRDAPQGAVVLSNWHRATPFWYLQQVEGLRPDVEVRYVYPQGSQPNDEVWLKRIAESIASRPVIVTNYFYAFAQTSYRWVPFHEAWLVREGPLDAPPQLAGQAAEFERGIRVLGYQLDATDLAPGKTLTLRVYWLPTEPLERDYSSFVHLVGPQGVVGQGDIVHHARDHQPGEVRVDVYRFPLYLHTLPGDYQLITGFYYQTGGGLQRLLTQGADHLPLAKVAVHASREPAATLHPCNQRFADGLMLTGVDYDQTVPGQMRLYLHWQRPKELPLVRAIRRSPQSQGVLVRLTDQDAPLAQATLPYLEPGQAATVALDIPDGLERITLSLASAEGNAVPTLGPWNLSAKKELSLRSPRGAVHYVPLGGEMAFAGFDRLPATVSAGQGIWLRPRLLALRPLTADYSISVGLRRGDLSWEEKVDSTPALGAIPTLKWMRGWLVEDAHLLAVPADAPAGGATVTLGVYDAFTLEPLHVLDERLVARGQGIQIEMGQVNIDR